MRKESQHQKGQAVQVATTWFSGAKHRIGEVGLVAEVLPPAMFPGVRIQFADGAIEPFSDYELEKA